MTPHLQLGGRRARWAAALVAVAAALLFVRLGGYGFWEPHEIEVAERAAAAGRLLDGVAADLRALAPSISPDPAAGDDPGEELPAPLRAAPDPASIGEPGMAVAPSPAPSPSRRAGVRPPGAPRARAAAPPERGRRLTESLISTGIGAFGRTELGARALVALAGLLGVLATALLGARLGGARAGLLAGFAFLSFPVVVLGSRHLTSDVPMLAAAAILALGLVGLVRPSRLGPLPPAAVLALDGALVAIGAFAVVRGAAAWNGLVPPLVGVGIGGLVAGLSPAPAGGRRDRRALVVGVLATAVGLGLVLATLAQVFDVVDLAPGERGLFGKGLGSTPLLARWWPKLPPGTAPDEVVALLGGAWKAEGDARVTATALFEPIAFGTFPWVALAPLAVAGVALGARAPGRRFAGAALAAWAAVAWATATVAAHKVGPTAYPAFAALAVALGLALDDLLASRVDDGAAAAAPALPVAALFALACALIVAKDLAAFPERMTSLTLGGATLKLPEGMRLHRGLLVVGGAFGLAIAAALALGGRRARIGRRAAGVAVGVALAGAAFLAQVWSPALAARFSTRGVFATYEALRRPGDRLGIVGAPGPGPRFYAGEGHERLAGRTELLAFLRGPERAFALVRASELCALRKAASAEGTGFVVLDDTNEQFLLLSNQLRPGEVDRNPLAAAIVRVRPTDLGHPVDAVFEDTIRLIGVRLPERVARGERFEVTTIYEVLKPIARNWKVFVHFDAGAARFQGDHDPLRGRCGTSYLQPGEFVLDRFEVEAGGLVAGTPRGRYQLFTGFYVGSNPNYTNMKVTRGDADDAHRVRAATIVVD